MAGWNKKIKKQLGGVTIDMIKAAESQRAYEKATPEQFGNLHGRMKYLMEKMREAGWEDVPHDVWHAVFDLETELKHHEVQPYSFGQGRRIKPRPVNKS